MAFTKLLYHIVFSTKQRVTFLKENVRPRVHDYVSGIIHSEGGQVLAADGSDDHVHLAVLLPPTKAIADLMRVAKAGSSKWIHQSLPGMGGFAWQDSYSAFTVSPSILPAVLEYVHDQREHHRKMSFTDELRLLLDKHGITYDERYL